MPFKFNPLTGKFGYVPTLPEITKNKVSIDTKTKEPDVYGDSIVTDGGFEERLEVPQGWMPSPFALSKSPSKTTDSVSGYAYEFNGAQGLDLLGWSVGMIEDVSVVGGEDYKMKVTAKRPEAGGTFGFMVMGEDWLERSVFYAFSGDDAGSFVLPRPELISNNEFDDWTDDVPDGFTISVGMSATAVADAGAAEHGAYAVKFVSTGAFDYAKLTKVITGLSEDTEYRIKVVAKGDSGGEELGFYILNEDGDKIWNSNNRTWENFSVVEFLSGPLRTQSLSTDYIIADLSVDYIYEGDTSIKLVVLGPRANATYYVDAVSCTADDQSQSESEFENYVYYFDSLTTSYAEHESDAVAIPEGLEAVEILFVSNYSGVKIDDASFSIDGTGTNELPNGDFANWEYAINADDDVKNYDLFRYWFPYNFEGGQGGSFDGRAKILADTSRASEGSICLKMCSSPRSEDEDESMALAFSEPMTGLSGDVAVTIDGSNEAGLGTVGFYLAFNGNPVYGTATKCFDFLNEAWVDFNGFNNIQTYYLGTIELTAEMETKDLGVISAPENGTIVICLVSGMGGGYYPQMLQNPTFEDVDGTDIENWEKGGSCAILGNQDSSYFESEPSVAQKVLTAEATGDLQSGYIEQIVDGVPGIEYTLEISGGANSDASIVRIILDGTEDEANNYYDSGTGNWLTYAGTPEPPIGVAVEGDLTELTGVGPLEVSTYTEEGIPMPRSGRMSVYLLFVGPNGSYSELTSVTLTADDEHSEPVYYDNLEIKPITYAEAYDGHKVVTDSDVDDLNDNDTIFEYDSKDGFKLLRLNGDGEFETDRDEFDFSNKPMLVAGHSEIESYDNSSKNELSLNGTSGIKLLLASDPIDINSNELDEPVKLMDAPHRGAYLITDILIITKSVENYNPEVVPPESPPYFSFVQGSNFGEVVRLSIPSTAENGITKSSLTPNLVRSDLYIQGGYRQPAASEFLVQYFIFGIYLPDYQS